MKFLRVSEQRFVQEYEQIISQAGHKFVDWFVDHNNQLHVFLFFGMPYAYCYICNANDIPESIKLRIKRRGEFLGFVELNYNTERPKFNEVKVENILFEF